MQNYPLQTYYVYLKSYKCNMPKIVKYYIIVLPIKCPPTVISILKKSLCGFIHDSGMIKKSDMVHGFSSVGYSGERDSRR